TWDGRAVRTVREEYPEEYARRGRDIFTFKIGNKAENFYDVQYRAVRALRKILEEDDSRNIVIVSHSAVIRALENNLKGDRVDDPWESLAKGEYRKVEI
ncbi:MAG: histidine phosphatase family protein, partial [Firmicutes bacterium]|nr:histidine phosphatase family protein [Bacillota bacterium]